MAARKTFYDIDAQNWPVVVVRFPGVPETSDDIDAFQAHFIAVLELARKGSARVPPTPLYIAMNINGIGNTSLSQQLRAPAFIKDIRPYVVGVVQRTALTASSPLVRTIFEAITAAQALSTPYELFDNEEDALASLQTYNQTRLAESQSQQ